MWESLVCLQRAHVCEECHSVCVQPPQMFSTTVSDYIISMTLYHTPKLILYLQFPIIYTYMHGVFLGEDVLGI